MPRQPSPGRGPVSSVEARRLVEALLGETLDQSAVVTFWAMLRGQLVAAQRRVTVGGPGAQETKLRLRGQVNPRWREPFKKGDRLPPVYLPASTERGRPPERAMDEANAFLLGHFPQLEGHPLEFALLEALVNADAAEQKRFPSEDSWAKDRNRARANYQYVVDRARKRLVRARRFLDGPQGPEEVRRRINPITSDARKRGEREPIRTTRRAPVSTNRRTDR